MKKNSLSTFVILGGFLNLVVGGCAYVLTKDLAASAIWIFIGLSFLLFDSKVKTSSHQETLNMLSLKKVASVVCIILAFGMFAYMLYTDVSSLSYNATGSVHDLR